MRVSSILWLGVILSCVACQQQSAEPAVILPPLVQSPIPELDPSFEKETFKAEEGLEKLFSSGSQVRIPADALTDSAGNRISGEVEMHYREMHDALSIYLSGVPMSYPSPGDEALFTTAGTFELRVFKQGVPVFLDTMAAVEVRMASYESGDDYDFFFLNEDARRWDSLGTTKAVINPRKRKLKKQIKRLEPKLAFPLSSKYFAFDYSAIIDVMYDNNLANVDHSGVGKKLKAYGLGYADLWTYDVIEWEGKKELAAMMVWKNRSKKPIPEWKKDKRIKIEKIKGNQYRASCYNKDSTKVYKGKIEAIMPLTALFAFPPEKWNQDYQATMTRVKQTREAYRQTAAVFRDFEIRGFGIYNWDKIWKQEGRVELAAEFRFSKTSFNDTLYQPELVFIPGDGKSLVRLPKSTWSAMSLVPDKGGRLFCVLPGKKIAVYPVKQYARIDFEMLRKMEEPAFTFKMDKAITFEDEADLRKLVGLRGF